MKIEANSFDLDSNLIFWYEIF